MSGNDDAARPGAPGDAALPTALPLRVAEVWDRADGLYMCIKDQHSRFLWVNQNFADLVGQSKDALIGHGDDRAEHVADDRRVMANGVPLLNLRETIDVPTGEGGMRPLQILTQKGLLRRQPSGEVIGITVCFALTHPAGRPSAAERIRQLKLRPTGVGGYFARGPEADSVTLDAALPERFRGDRALYSSNYFLLPEGEVLRLHSLHQDELWFFHEGSALKLHLFLESGEYRCVIVGSRLEAGEVFQAVAPHGAWFGAELLGPGYALVSCSLAPGYDPRDSADPSSEKLAALKQAFPAHADLLDRLNRPHHRA